MLLFAPYNITKIWSKAVPKIHSASYLFDKPSLHIFPHTYCVVKVLICSINLNLLLDRGLSKAVAF